MLHNMLVATGDELRMVPASTILCIAKLIAETCDDDTALRRGLPHLALVGIGDDIMAPTLSKGDVALVDRSVTTVGAAGMYLCSIGEEVRVHRIQRFGNGTLLLIADNPTAEPRRREVPVDLVKVLGRVECVLNRM